METKKDRAVKQTAQGQMTSTFRMGIINLCVIVSDIVFFRVSFLEPQRNDTPVAKSTSTAQILVCKCHFPPKAAGLFGKTG